MKKKTVGLAIVIFALTAGSALAVTLSGDGTLVGSPQNDTIAAGNGNDTVWGLAGADTIHAGNGNDVIDGDGQCGPGVKPGDYPHGLPSGEYCEHGQMKGDGGDTIAAGNGDDVIYGGGGKNTISAGTGDDTIYGGPIGDTIAAGLNSQGNDTIYLGLGTSYTGSTVSTGEGDDVIHAQNGVKDTISCQRGNGTTVYADRSDAVKGCARVIYTADPNPGPNPRPAADARRSNHSLVHGKTKKRSYMIARRAHNKR